MLLDPAAGDTGTGLDQLIDIINGDPGLAGANTGGDISGGAFAANRMNQIVVEAITQTGAGADKVFTAAEVQQINAYIRANHLAEWTEYHGDDEDGVETGFHLVQNDGATSKHRGANTVDTVADGLYHLGFTIENGRFLNEDGDANATVEQVAQWLTQFYTDHSTTGTGLDRITNLIMADSGLAANIPEAQIEAGADAANGMNQLIADGIAATGADADGRITVDDVVAINTWIRSDEARYEAFVAFHGDDENGVETGFHLVQGDGANTTFFGRNLVNTVADGLYHIGFEIQGDRFVNEDGDANQTVADVASWIDYFYSDASTTGTGLDRIVDTIKIDRGLSKNTAAADISDGSAAADGLNHLIVDSIVATDAEADGWVTIEDLYRMNSWVKEDADRFAHFLELHGDDENGSETGFHLVQNDGASTDYFGRNLVNTVADGMYHIGFEIEDGRFLNEDGDANQTLVDVSAWINYFYGGKTLIYGTGNGDEINGTDASEHIIADSGNDVIDAGGASDLVYGGWGCDIIFGGLGEDILYGQGGNDQLDGGEDGDIYRVSGNVPGGWSSFEDYDTYIDTGVEGVDVIEAWGDGDVDIGLKSFGPASGIERIDATGAAGIVTLLGDWSSNYLDFRGVEFVGDIVIDAGYGEDTVYGNDQDNVVVAGGGDDWVDAGEGSDTYRVTGNVEGGWSSFQDYDTYADSGLDGTDTIAAIGEDVDIGIKSFGPESGIEVVDGTGATGRVRMLGDWQSNILDFRGASFIGGNIVIDGGYGDDQIYGTTDDDTIIGGGGSDAADGGEGSDHYEVTGNQAGGWSSFQDFDSYADSGLDGTDAIVALGEQVDIGLRSFGPETGIEVIDATGASGAVRLLGDWTGNVLDFRNVTFLGNPLDVGYGIVLASNVVIDGGYGDDTIYGNDQDNVIGGGGGNDWVDGGEGSDIYVVSGNAAGGWSSFQDYDTYADSGLGGIDSIAAVGDGDVDIGLLAFGATSGIEVIDASLALGTVRLLGDWAGNVLDFRTTTLVGANVVIDGGHGNDTIRGSAEANVIIGGGGNDYVDGGGGSDTYRVSGNAAGGWSSFQDHDTYADSGKTGIDTIAALGAGNVDIGLLNFGAASGIERIDGTGALGTVRLLGDWNTNLLDFRTTMLVGTNIVIDGGHGNDTIYGSAEANIIIGGGGNDTVNGGEGSDTYRVSGNVAGGWSSFQDYDTYADTGKVGTDTIKAMGVGAVDIGLLSFSSTSGIEVVDGTGTIGAVRLLGDWNANSLDFRTTTFVGTNITIDGNGGDDTIYGSAEANTIVGGTGRDRMDGGNGGDTYRVTGNQASGWSSFSDFDTYADTGATGTDTIKAIGTGKVDIGLTRFDANNGIEVIDATGATGQTRILGNYTSDSFDFSNVTFLGANILIHAGDGDDVVKGSAGANLINGGNGNDSLSGGLGADKFLFDTALSKWGNVDRIVDFSVVDDTIQIDDAIFKKAGALGTLAAGAFVKGTKALDASDRIVYNGATGDVFYDADGSGKGEAILFAKLATNLALTNADFVVV
jgi:Ca2+-binding RTX toxin-like protein